MLSTSLVVFTSNLVQAIGAVVLAMVLSAFHRHYQRPFLLTWAWSWWAFCVSLAGGSISLLLVGQMAAGSPARLVASCVFLTASYWQAAWLLFGTWEIVNERLPSRRLEWAVLAGLFLLAAAIVVSSAFLPSHVRFLLRIGLRSLLLAIAFLAASRGVWRSRPEGPGFGRRLSAAAFLLYGLHQVHYLVIVISQITSLGSMAYAAYLAPFDFLLQSLIAIGMVIWLLEEERQRVLDVSHRIEHLSLHDSLTDLPNRSLLLERLQIAIVRAEARRERLAVLFLDLDRFKLVNESLGNRNGDELLKALSERFRQNLRGTDLVARVAADEFAILIPGIDSEAVVSRVAEKLLAITRLPFSLQGNEVYLTASIGVSRSPEDGSDAETLLKRAEIAMVRAKETRRDHYQLYCRSMDSHTLEHLSLETDLRKALLQEPTELTLYYQPVLDSQRKRVEGVEALLRWKHPARGLMLPAEFLWLADSSGLANVLDLWVLRTACREGQGWRRDGVTDLQLAVNLSPRSFQQPDLLRSIQEVLAETGFPASSLVVEITETLAMQNAEATLTVLRGLKELGVRIAIDDFGTGYSSLSYLTTFPIDTLKLDRSFVHTLGRGRGSEEVAAAVIALAVSLEITLVAEGVEEEEQLRWLHGLGCDRYQGFFFSPPLPARECRDLLARGDLEARIDGSYRLTPPPAAPAAAPA